MMLSDTGILKHKGWHFNLFFYIRRVTAKFFVLGKDCAHLKYLLLSLKHEYSHTFLVFLMFSIVLSLWMQKYMLLFY